MTKNSKRLCLVIAVAVLAVGIAALSGTFATGVTYDDEKLALTDSNRYNVSVRYIHSNDISAGYKDIFSAGNFTGASKWCPGRTEIIYLKLQNNEAFPVNCTVSLNVQETAFDDTLRYAVLSRDLLTDRQNQHPANWAEYVQQADPAAVLTEGAHILWEKQPLPIDGTEQYLALAIHMDENATNEYENKTMKMNFILRFDANYEPGAAPAQQN